MNYRITFSTYENATGKSIGKTILQRDLQQIASINNIQGFSLTDQIGYWAGEYELSYCLTLLDTTPKIAEAVAVAIKKQYRQDAVILEALANTNVRFI